MNKHLFTYLFISTLLLTSGSLCHAAVMDNVTETLESVNGYMEEGKTYQENYMNMAKEYIDGKVGALGDIQGAAKKAEKAKKAAKWAQKKADKAKKFAESAKKKAEAAKKFADDRKKEITDAKQFVDDRKKDIEDGKQKLAEGKEMLDDAKDTAQALKETSSSALQAAQAKAGNLQEKAGIKSSEPSNQAALAASNQAAIVAQKADVISELSSQSNSMPESISLDSLPNQEEVSISADEVLAAAQAPQTTDTAVDLMQAEPIQGLSVADVNQFGTLDAKAKIVPPVAEVVDGLLTDEQLKEYINLSEDVDVENPNKVKADPQAAAKLESKLQALDAQKRASLKKSRSSRQTFGAKVGNVKAVGETNE